MEEDKKELIIAPQGPKRRARRRPGTPISSPRGPQNAFKDSTNYQNRPKRAPKPKTSERASPSGSIWGPEEVPKRPPRAPKRNPREPQNALKTIFGSKTLTFQNSLFSQSEINVLEGRRAILGSQNRPEEAPREDKQRLRRR